MPLFFAISAANIVLLGVAGAVALLLLFGLGAYNKLVELRNRYRNSFSQIDVQLKRRHDLIPNLVEVAKGYMGHERETLEAVITARNQAVNAQQQAAVRPGDPALMKDLSAAEGQLTGVLGRLFALSESYPDLKANQNMMALQQELASTEDKVAFARQTFNDSVMTYNTTREQFPTVLFSGMFGFDAAQLFELDSPKEREVPRVSF